MENSLHKIATRIQLKIKTCIALINKRLKPLCISLLIFSGTGAQHTVKMIVYDPAKKNEIYLAGTFNGWNPGNSSYRLTDLDDTHKYIILRNIATGEYFFKFTRGTWPTTEATYRGENREIQVKQDTVVQYNITGWTDDFKDMPHSTINGKFTIRIDVYEPVEKGDIFLTGTFNGWDPGDESFKLSPTGSGLKSITLQHISPGKYSFKFTRGNWSTVETDQYGFDMDDRMVDIRHDTVLKLTIAGWLDKYIDLRNFPDTIQVRAGWVRSNFYLDRNLDSSYKYGNMAYELSRNIGDKKYLISSSNILGEVYHKQGNSAKALELFLQAIPIAEAARDSFNLTTLNKAIGGVFESEKEFAKAISYYNTSIKYCPSNDQGLFFKQQIYLSLGKIYLNKSNLDSAKYYAVKCNNYNEAAGSNILLGDIEKISGNRMKAMEYYRLSAEIESHINTISINLAKAYQRIAREFIENNQPDSGFYYARKSLEIANQVKNPYSITDANILLYQLFAAEKKYDSAFYFQSIVLKANDSLYNREKENQVHNLVLNDQLHKKEIEAEIEKFRFQSWIYSLGGGLLILLLTSGLLIRNNKQKKEANILLSQQKNTIEKTLSELKATQAQLIQSEKMASLGELTAGIAHEIQNPLNFVNNFSEINKELLSEMNEEISKGNFEEVKAIAKDVTENEEKIILHGKRADAIVKGMLQHTRSSNSAKEASNINALADEFLRLSYHGLRARDNSFNANMHTDFDPSIGKIEIVPQDIGRVLLNLYNNAFYAVDEKKKKQNGNYTPTVSVSTKKLPGYIEIRVSDNGSGIPKKVLDKIFQPFFTTKPTGQGTGLGLSLSYDIVKAHGGEIKVNTQEGEGSEFVIYLQTS